MKNLFSSIALSGLILFFGLFNPVLGWDKTPTESMKPEEVDRVVLLAEVDVDMYKQVVNEYDKVMSKDSHVKAVVVDINSPGGQAILGADIARMFRKMSDEKKVRVEFHAHGMCASACTLILASGTPGDRNINRFTFFLVHPIQQGNMFGMSCIKHTDGEAKSVEEKAGNTILEIYRDLYAKLTGRPVKETESWMSCGSERVGQGKLAVEMGIADKVED